MTCSSLRMVFWILVGQDNDAVAPVTIILRIVYWRSEIKRKIDKSYDINGSLYTCPNWTSPQKKWMWSPADTRHPRDTLSRIARPPVESSQLIGQLRLLCLDLALRLGSRFGWTKGSAAVQYSYLIYVYIISYYIHLYCFICVWYV